MIDLEVRVAQVNHEAPWSHRLLVVLSGQLPPGVDPMGELEQVSADLHRLILTPQNIRRG